MNVSQQTHIIPRIFMVSSGLGHVQRGFESFFRSGYDALCAERTIDLYLFKGGGKQAGKERGLWNLPRNGAAAKRLGRMIGRSGYFIEQLTFFFSLLPRLIIHRPAVVYVSDVVLGNLLRLPRQLCGYRILYNNSGPTSPAFFHRWEHIQQVTPQYYEKALQAGVPGEKQILVPLAVPLSERMSRPGDMERDEMKKKLNLPADRKLLLSVGAIQTTRKRMDYVIREVASIPEPRPYLLLLGAREEESDSVLQLGKSLLPGRFEVRSVKQEEVNDYYRAADIFTLASLDEGFGLVYVEALAHGLPCLVHDYPTARFVLGELGIYGDLTKEGSLGAMISGLKPEDFSADKALARHANVYERFSWDRLRPKYVEMFMHCAGIETHSERPEA